MLFTFIYIKFHENRFRGPGNVGGRISPSPIDLAHRLYHTACTTVQVVMLLCGACDSDINAIIPASDIT